MEGRWPWSRGPPGCVSSIFPVFVRFRILWFFMIFRCFMFCLVFTCFMCFLFSIFLLVFQNSMISCCFCFRCFAYFRFAMCLICVQLFLWYMFCLVWIWFCVLPNVYRMLYVCSSDFRNRPSLMRRSHMFSLKIQYSLVRGPLARVPESGGLLLCCAGAPVYLCHLPQLGWEISDRQ